MNASDVTPEALIAYKGLLVQRRTNFDSLWQRVNSIFWPDGQTFTIERAPGSKTTVGIYDSLPAFALERGAAAMETFLTPRTQQWHRVVASDPELMKDPEVKAFLENLTDQLFRARNDSKSGFYAQNNEDNKSILAYGNGCLRVDAHPTGGTRYRYTHVGKTWIDTDENGNVDSIFYEYKLSAKNAVKRWGDKVPRHTKETANGSNPLQERTYLHACIPNPQFNPYRKSPKFRAYVTLEIDMDEKLELERSYDYGLPYIWSRYTVNPSETYGRGPAMTALPEAQTLQEMQQTFLRAGQKIADPPLLAVNDGILGKGGRRVNLGAGKLTLGGLDPAGRPMIAPLQTGGRLDINIEMANALREVIKSAFHLDIWDILVQDRPEMTATEVIARNRERGQLYAPMIGRQQSEKYGPLITREIEILQRQGKVGQVPAALVEAGGAYEIVYESDITRLQKSASAEAYPRTFELYAPFIQNDPALLHLWNQEKAIRAGFETLGGQSSDLLSEDEFRDVRDQIAQAQNDAADEANAPTAAKGFKDAAMGARALQAAA